MEAPCWQCTRELASGATLSEVLKDHSNCHGWFHCTNCCGPCPVCEHEGGFEHEDDE